jgi:type IV pilus assembly protein PilW
MSARHSRIGRLRKPPDAPHQAGLTLVELMISMTLGLFVVMASTALLLSTKAGYLVQDEGARMEETGRYALEIIARAVRQAAYENWDSAEAPIVADRSLSANIAGLDASRLKEKTEGIDAPASDAVNGSDVLALRFFGAGAGAHGDGTIINCAGFGVPAAASAESAGQDRGWSIFYVAEGAGGEPELYCKYRSADGGWASDAIARGIESFQVLYGLDTDDDGLPNLLLTATAINDLDNSLVLDGADSAARAADRNRKTHWKKVAVVQVALLVRGSRNAAADATTTQYDLFGKEYADAHASRDKGTRIKQAARFKAPRKIFTAVIQLRNQAAGSAT